MQSHRQSLRMAKESPASHKKLDILPVPKKKSEKKKLPMVEEFKGSSYGKGKGKIAVSTLWKFMWKFNFDAITQD